MNILVIGSGAREHAICCKLMESKSVENVYCLPGNYGMKKDQIKLVEIDLFDFDKIINFVQNNDISYSVVGPENVLVEGIVDEFSKYGLAIFGPSKNAAQLEGSKVFAKKIMSEANVSTANFQTFSDFNLAIEYLQYSEYPIVIKKDGIAAGKGVAVVQNISEATKICREFFNNSSSGIIIEEYLEGEEFSAMYFAQDSNIYPMPFVHDYKRAYDRNEGPNTGGMGAYCPMPQMNDNDRHQADQIVESVISAMKQQRIEFTGIIYAGLIKTKNGVKVIEFNMRFGDPETEVVLPLLKSDLAIGLDDLLHKRPTKFIWNESMNNVGVMCATNGYPVHPIKTKLEIFKTIKAQVFYANLDEKMNCSGRSFIVVSSADNIEAARTEVYEEVPKLPNFFFRKDIGE